MKKKLLLLGAGGFIGRQIVEMFGDEYGIIPVKSDIDGKRLDLTDYAELLSILDQYKPDAVLNLAGTSYHRTKNDAEIYESNILIQLNLHEAVNQLKLKTKIVLSSSSAVYKSSVKPVNERSMCLPVNSYAKAKYIQERIALSYYPKQHVCIARLFNVIGPFQNKNFFIPTLINHVLKYKNHEISVVTLKTLNAMRDFTYINDVCSALACLIDKGESGEVYNVCRGEGVSIEKVIAVLQEILDISELPIETKEDYVKEGINYQVGSNEKIRELGWSPEYYVTKSLKRILREEYGC